MEMKQEMKRFIVDYIMSCAPASADGALKADSHERLVSIFVKHEGGDEDVIRRVTRQLTDNLDTEIGMPMDMAPNYRLLWRKFYDKFVEYARAG